MKTVIITSVSQFNGVWYATFKILFGFGSRMQELFGTNVTCIGKAYAILQASDATKPKNFIKGSVYSNVELVPLEKFEMEMQPLYNADSKLVGNIAKPTCSIDFTDETKLLATLTVEEIESIPEKAEKK